MGHPRFTWVHDENKGDCKTKQIIFSVKARRVQSAYVRDLHGVIDRQDAQIGVRSRAGVPAPHG